MIENVPKLDARTAEDVATQVTEALRRLPFTDEPGRPSWWTGRSKGPSSALAHIFGHLSESVISRLNQLPEKHFLAFLNEAGIELLPAQPARTDIVFAVGPDAPDAIRVPAGTQVATLQTETRPEIVFETQERCVVTPTALMRCIAVDPVRWSAIDGSVMSAVTRGAGLPDGEQGFAVFDGVDERERVLFLGDAELFHFPDRTSRRHGTVTLRFNFAQVGDPVADGGWRLAWKYWNGGLAEPKWQELPTDRVSDETNNFSRDGEVTLRDLPELVETVAAGRPGRWIACSLTGGTAREHLPVIASVVGRRRIDVRELDKDERALASALTAAQVNASFTEVKTDAEFLPFGQRPDRLDAFYIRSDEAFSKAGATAVLRFEGLVGVPAKTESPNLSALTVVWEYHGEDGWRELGRATRVSATTARLRFADTTLAFTASGDGEVRFRVPGSGSLDPAFRAVDVNGQSGYWVRARIADGNYSVPAAMVTGRGSVRSIVEPKTYAPVASRLRVTYREYLDETRPRPPEMCASRADSDERDHTDEMLGTGSFAPFAAAEEGRALYLGFAPLRKAEPGQPAPPAFPPNEWVQLLLDVADPAETGTGSEAERGFASAVWEYASSDGDGKGWRTLQVSDGTSDLRERGRVGFFGPREHANRSEFGETAFWLRCRAHSTKPVAQASGPKSVRPDEHDERVIRLDASRSQAFDGGDVAWYEWRRITAEDTAFEATAEATPSVRLTRDDETLEGGFVSPRLKRILLNSAEVRNTLTIAEETLRPLTTAERAIAAPAPGVSAAPGAGTPRANQIFALERTPVLPDEIEIVVREEDTGHEPQEFEEDAGREQPEPGADSGGERWVTWKRIESFFGATPLLRGYALDPINGWVQFGDGERGKLPPAGADRILARFYRTLNGAAGNVRAGEVSVVRNPTADLAPITGVTNPEPAAGGTDAETRAQLKQRGPQLLKHRHQAVTKGGFEWIGREASAGIAQVLARPATAPDGWPPPGAVSVVILPTDGERPKPSAALLRQVKEQLEGCASNTLTSDDRAEGSGIFVGGPQYVEARVSARVFAQEPKEADEVAVSIRERLKKFLDPLKWPLGRDVYLGDVYAEIESVPGVDHVAYLELNGSIEQHNLVLAPDYTSFDRAGFSAGDRVVLATGDGTILVDDLEIDSIAYDQVNFAETRWPASGSFADLMRCAVLAQPSGDGGGKTAGKRLAVAPFQLVLDEKRRVKGLRRGYTAPHDIAPGSEVSTLDRRVRLLLADTLFEGDPLTQLQVYGFKVDDLARLVGRDNAELAGGLRVVGLAVGTDAEPEPDAKAPAGEAAVGATALRARIALEVADPAKARALTDEFKLPPEAALMSTAGDIRLPLQGFRLGGAGGKQHLATVAWPVQDERFCVVSRGQRDPRLTFLPLDSVAPPEERIIVPEGNLAVSGEHAIEMTIEMGRAASTRPTSRRAGRAER